MFKLRPSVAQGLPEGVLLYIEGRSWDRAKGIHLEKSPGLFYLRRDTFKFILFKYLFPIPFAVCAFFTFRPYGSKRLGNTLGHTSS